MIMILLIIILLSSCSQLVHQETAQDRLALPMAQPFGQSRRIVQQLTVTCGNQQQSLLVVLELDAQHIAMAGISNEGLSLFNLHYDGKTVVYEQSLLVPKAISPVAIITDLQLAYWPIAELQALLPAGWRITSNENKRFLYDSHEKRIAVDFLEPDRDWPKIIQLVNYRNNYLLQLKTLSYDLIPE